MKRFFEKLIPAVIVVSILTAGLVYSNAEVVIPYIPGPEAEKVAVVCVDWVYIAERDNYMHVTLYADGTVVPTRDKSFESVFNNVSGTYATNQEGFMQKGYVLKDNELYYFAPAGNAMGKLISNAVIRYNDKDYNVDEYGRIQGNLSDIFARANVYTMGLYKQGVEKK